MSRLHEAVRRRLDVDQSGTNQNEISRFPCQSQVNRKMLKTIMILSMCLLAAFSLSLNARAQDTEGAYTEGPVVQVTYIHVEYGKLAECVDWLNSTWKPTLEAMRKAGLVLDYKVFRASPKTLDQPNIFVMITFKNMA